MRSLVGTGSVQSVIDSESSYGEGASILIEDSVFSSDRIDSEIAESGSTLYSTNYGIEQPMRASVIVRKLSNITVDDREGISTSGELSAGTSGEVESRVDGTMIRKLQESLEKCLLRNEVCMVGYFHVDENIDIQIANI